MKIHALVEGPSEDVFLKQWSKRFLPEHELKVHPHQGKGKLPPKSSKNIDAKKRGLLDQLPLKLKAFGRSLDREKERVLVLIDADTDDTAQMRDRLDDLMETLDPCPEVRFCFAVEELEAFYLGDLKALKAAYPNHDHRMASSYEPDSIVGTWELFGRVIDDDGGNKVAWAAIMGKKLTTRPQESRSPSFKDFCREFGSLTESSLAAAPQVRRSRKGKVASPRDATGKRKR